MNPARAIPSALGIVFSRPKYILISCATSTLMFGLLTLLPVGRFDPQAFFYQLTGLDAISLASFGFFSLLVGVLIAMQVHLFHVSRQKATGMGIVSLLTSFLAGIFGSAVCAVCLAVIFSLVGIPVAVLSFLLTYRLEALGVSSVIALTSFYLSSKAIVVHREGCNVCQVK